MTLARIADDPDSPVVKNLALRQDDDNEGTLDPVATESLPAEGAAKKPFRPDRYVW